MFYTIHSSAEISRQKSAVDLYIGIFKKNVSNGTCGYVCMYEYVNAVGNIDMVQLHLWYDFYITVFKNQILYGLSVRGVHKVLVGKPEGQRPLGRPRRRWEDNIKMGLREVGGGCGDWMELAEDRDRWRALVSTAMNFGVP